MRFYFLNLYYSLQAQYLWARYSEDVVGFDANIEFLDSVDFDLLSFLTERVGTYVGLRADWFVPTVYPRVVTSDVCVTS